MSLGSLIPLAFVLLISWTPASSTPVTWSLNDFVFDDGGDASGSFVYDTSINAFLSIDVTTTAGTTRSGTTYQNNTGIGDALTADFIDPALDVIPGTSERLVLFLAAPLTDLGGTITISQAFEFTCANLECTFVIGNEQGLSLRRGSGSLEVSDGNAVPVPPTSSLVLLAIAVLCAAHGAAIKK